jgi:AraC family transcriptional regulator
MPAMIYGEDCHQLISHQPTSANLPPRVNEVHVFGGLMFQNAHFPERMEVASHTHEFAGLYYIMRGTLIETCRNRMHTLTPGTLIYQPIHEIHAICIAPGTRIFQIGMGSVWVDRIQQYAPLSDVSAELHGGPPLWLIRRLYHEFECYADLSPLLLEGLTLELLAAVSSYETGQIDPPLPRWLRQTQDLLHAHFAENLSPTAIAGRVGVHPAHLMRGFRQYFHCTVGDYVRRLRIEFARHQLVASDLPVSQVALEAGFADQSHFCRTFKATTGMTPAEYRNSSSRNPQTRNATLIQDSGMTS